MGGFFIPPTEAPHMIEVLNSMEKILFPESEYRILIISTVRNYEENGD